MTIEDAAFLRTLYIQEQGTVLRIENERFRVTVGDDDDEDIVNIPSIKVGQIVIFGACMVTPAAMRFCLSVGRPD
ncbi:CRISPR-associated protein Cas1 [Prosthecochloris aestuarii DSM 271]|uniref:CRISPR-associated protein Cas1 n=1 Tax=Prosthecochloris aestuarii (strain DSM 271 / SK 413) TaxID=290512 RepID=B4S548_PROA2|nr:CRISPR-associated endonuclease Cas1 [Prosthecochloris aestuarii]ACF46994.1 CRISPR-associated protein Cas1 [Prosthecochloris aestuarii DSM 271]